MFDEEFPLRPDCLCHFSFIPILAGAKAAVYRVVYLVYLYMIQIK